MLLKAKFFGVAPSWLLFGKEADKKETIQIANMIEALTPKSQTAVISVIERLLAAERASKAGEQ